MLILRSQRQLLLIQRNPSYLHLIKKAPRKILSTFTSAAKMDTINTTERLKKLRDLMKENRIDVYSMTRE